MNALTPFVALAVAYAGFTTLSLAMDRHQTQLLGRELPPRQTLMLRIAGGVLLGGSLFVCLGAWSTSVAILWWFGLLSLAGLALGLLLAYRPQWARPVGIAVAVAAVVVVIFGMSGMSGIAGGSGG